MNRAALPRVSVVVPTLNEEGYLPALAACLAAQTVPIHELIIADAGSSDRTQALALEAGARVVPGGLPGVGRNNGAAVASGDWLLFLDADVRLPPDALEVAFREMARERLDSASTWFVPDTNDAFLRFNHRFSAWFFRITSKVRWPHSIGAFLLVRREDHERIGGFDLTIKVAEDQDYVRRLSKIGRYGFLRRPCVIIAVRRFEDEGSLKMSLKWIGVELHRLVLGEVRTDHFRYFK